MIQFPIPLVLAQAIPPQTSQLGWILNTQMSMGRLLVVISAVAIFVGACRLIATRRSAAVLAAYLVLLPLPCIISLYDWIRGTAASLMVIAATPDIALTTSDVAGGFAEAFTSLQIALLLSAPTYAVLAYGLLARTMQPPTSGTKPLASAVNPPMTSKGSLPLPTPTL